MFNKLCPYCTNNISRISKDHIFPNFLGGKRKIDSCVKCNNLFGHTFEGKSSILLQNMHVFISSWGLKLRSVSPIWKNAIIKDGIEYNLETSEIGITPVLSKNHIRKDENGKIVSGVFKNSEDAEKIGQGLKAKNKIKDYTIDYDISMNVDNFKLENLISINNDLKRLALKMCVGLYTYFNQVDKTEIEEARYNLRKENFEFDPKFVFPAYKNYTDLDFQRKGLSHLIYIEQINTEIYGVVQFFGVLQVYCYLGKTKKLGPNLALLGILDPIQGDEVFKRIRPLNLKKPFYPIPLDILEKLIQEWLDKYRIESIERNATHPPNLKLGTIIIS